MGEFVQVSVASHVARVVLNRPDLHNAFNEVVIQEMIDALTDVGKRADVRVVVLQSEGKSFCAGADLQWMKKMVDYTFDENVQDARELARMLKAIRQCPKPVIARVHGAAFGGGVGLISACDMAGCLESSAFSLSEVKLGLLPAVISPFVLEKIGPAHASRYFLTAERFDAVEARRIGLVHGVFNSVETLDAWIEKMIETLKANGPEAVSVCKMMIPQVSGKSFETAEDITTRLIAERRSSAEGQEGIKAFLEKRSAAWISEMETKTGVS